MLPAFVKLATFMQAEYKPATERRGAHSCESLPDGVKMYSACLRFHTSTSMTADEIHATVSARLLQS